MKLNTTVILKYNHSDALAFEGKAAADVLKILDNAILVHHEYKQTHGYVWVPADPDSADRPTIEVLTGSIAEANESLSVRLKLAEAEKKLEQHKDMIAAAEQLSNPDES